MAHPSLLPTLAKYVRIECAHFCTPDAAIWVCDSPAVYRPRHSETTVFYQVFEQHFDNYVAVHEERFEPSSGPLRRVVSDRVEQFLACGRLQGGFARLRCPSCKSEHLAAFSCRTRNFCPPKGDQAKRAALFAEKLANDILPPVAYRHWTFTIPKAIRGLFERERRLLLRRLHREERLSERFMDNLLSWVHPGFSVFAGVPLSLQDPEQLERLARTITRPPLAADSIRRHDGLLEITTPPDPRTGSTHRLFDPLDWIHAVTALMF